MGDLALLVSAGEGHALDALDQVGGVGRLLEQGGLHPVSCERGAGILKRIVRPKRRNHEVAVGDQQGKIKASIRGGPG